jgi:hypothetical protein
MNNINNELIELAQRMPADASWNDVVYQLYLDGKVTLGLAENERDEAMSRELFDNLFIRAESAHDMPNDMRNTLIYHPGNTTTVAMVAGVIAAGFAFVFPPIAWLAAPVAFIAGFMGVLAGQPRAWVAMMLSLVTLLPFAPMVLNK